MRVPLIVAGLGVAAGRVERRPVSTLDVVGAILELAGAERAPRMTARSLAPMFGEGGEAPREVVVSGLTSRVGALDPRENKAPGPVVAGGRGGRSATRCRARKRARLCVVGSLCLRLCLRALRSASIGVSAKLCAPQGTDSQRGRVRLKRSRVRLREAVCVSSEAVLVSASALETTVAPLCFTLCTAEPRLRRVPQDGLRRCRNRATCDIDGNHNCHHFIDSFQEVFSQNHGLKRLSRVRPRPRRSHRSGCPDRQGSTAGVSSCHPQRRSSTRRWCQAPSASRRTSSSVSSSS